MICINNCEKAAPMLCTGTESSRDSHSVLVAEVRGSLQSWSCQGPSEPLGP